jgi:hypothetical protein
MSGGEPMGVSRCCAHGDVVAKLGEVRGAAQCQAGECRLLIATSHSLPVVDLSFTVIGPIRKNVCLMGHNLVLALSRYNSSNPLFLADRSRIFGLSHDMKHREPKCARSVYGALAQY